MATNNAINSGKPIEVAKGGTGAATFTQYGALYGNTTSAIGVTPAGTDGQVILGATGAAPAFATMTSTAGSIVYTPGANTLNLDVLSWVDKTAWTPVLKFGGGTTGITYGTQTGVYVRIANAVFYHMKIVLTSKGSDTGAATITGLPLSAIVGANFAARTGFSEFTFTGYVYAIIPASSSTLSLLYTTTGAGESTVTDADFANTTEISLTGSYFV